MQSPSQPRHPSQILQDIRSEYEKRNNLTTQAAQKHLSKMCQWKESTWGNLERSTLVSGQEWKDDYTSDMVEGSVIKENSRYHKELIAWERIRDAAAGQSDREEYLQQQAREQQAGEQQSDPTPGKPPTEAVMAVMAVKEDKNVVNGDNNVVNGDNNGGGRGQDKRKWYWIAGLGGCAVLLLLCALGVTTAYLYVQRDQLARQTPVPPVVIEKEVPPVVIEKEVTRIVEVPKIEATMAPEQTQPLEATRPPEVSAPTAKPKQETPTSRSQARPASIHLKTGQTTTLADGWTWICIGHFSVKAPDGRVFNHYHDGGIHMGLITIFQADSKARLSGPDGMPDGVPIGDCIPVSVGEKEDKISWAIDIELGRGCTGTGCDMVRVVEIDRNCNVVSDYLR